MKIFRFMSKEEFDKFKNGETLINNTKHNGKTNSVGFCFLNLDDYTPEEALHFLSGIVSFDVCAVFETDKVLNQTYGIYAKPLKSTSNIMLDLVNLINGFNDQFEANEYCICEYNNKDFKLLKYTEDIWAQWTPTESQNKLIWRE